LWHVTLPFIGDFEALRIPELQNLAGRIQVEPFRLGFDRLEYWIRPKVACLVPSIVPAELERLVTSLDAILEPFGIASKDRTYRPHITVSRGARSFTTERLAARVVTEWSSFELMESVSGQGGVNYIPLKPSI